MKIVFFFVVTFFCGNIYASDLVQIPSEPTLCKSFEVNVVSCEVEGRKKKVISICAGSSDNGRTFDNIRYLFGQKNNIQLEYSVKQNNTKSKMYRGVDNGTFTTYFGFKNGEYFYVIGVPEERYGAKAFLNIFKNNEIITSLQCKTNSFGMKNIQSNLLTTVDGNELADGNVVVLSK